MAVVQCTVTRTTRETRQLVIDDAEFTGEHGLAPAGVEDHQLSQHLLESGKLEHGELVADRLSEHTLDRADTVASNVNHCGPWSDTVEVPLNATDEQVWAAARELAAEYEPWKPWASSQAVTDRAGSDTGGECAGEPIGLSQQHHRARPYT
jgi:hypothetical protein